MGAGTSTPARVIGQFIDGLAAPVLGVDVIQSGDTITVSGNINIPVFAVPPANTFIGSALLVGFPNNDAQGIARNAATGNTAPIFIDAAGNVNAQLAAADFPDNNVDFTITYLV